MKVYFLQRLFAYLIDSLIIFLFSTFIALFVPVSDDYVNSLNKSDEIINSYLDGKITEEEYVTKYAEVNYIIEKERVILTVINIIITIAYFGAYPYYMNGQTVGKKFMNIKVLSYAGNHPSYISFVLRCIIIHGVVFNLINLIVLLFTNSISYFSISGIISFIYFMIVIISSFMVIFRKDGRGLHDLIFGTKVMVAK